MTTFIFLTLWVLIGIAVLVVAFASGRGRPRRGPRGRTRGSGARRVLLPVIYLALGVAIPALVIADSGEQVGGTPSLADAEASGELEEGKKLFRQSCASCHTLDAVNARGITGPNLDQLGELSVARVRSAISIGGTGQGRMPAGLLEGEDAQAVAIYVARTAGR